MLIYVGKLKDFYFHHLWECMCELVQVKRYTYNIYRLSIPTNSRNSTISTRREDNLFFGLIIYFRNNVSVPFIDVSILPALLH